MKAGMGCVLALVVMLVIWGEAAAMGEGHGIYVSNVRPNVLPNVPPQNVLVLIAKTNQAQPRDVTTIRALGVCQIIPNSAPATPSLENTILPIVSAKDYFSLYEHRTTITSAANITNLQQPQHGILRLVTETDRGTIFHSSAGPLDPAAGLYVYIPEKGYFGNDSATVLVDVGGVKVKVIYFFQTIDTAGVGEGLQEALCEKGTHWKISSTLDANGNSAITSVEYQSSNTNDAGTTAADSTTLASTLGSSVLSNLAGDTAGVAINLADLPGAAEGQTTGSTITLDTNKKIGALQFAY